jgi:hypothetical protein
MLSLFAPKPGRVDIVYRIPPSIGIGIPSRTCRAATRVLRWINLSPDSQRGVVVARSPSLKGRSLHRSRFPRIARASRWFRSRNELARPFPPEPEPIAKDLLGRF